MRQPATRFRLSAALVLATVLPAAAAARDACPDLTGRYRVAAIGPAQTDLLAALQIGARPQDDDLRIESSGGGVMTVQVLAARGEAAPPRQLRTLFEGSDFECRAGGVLLKSEAPTSRKLGETYLEGRSTVRLARAADGSLAVEVSFNGGERTDLYRYDSARVSIPRPFSGRTLQERFAWLPAERVPPPPPVAAASPESRREDELRMRLSALLGRAQVGFVKAVPGGMRVQLRATRADEMVAAEDRLRAAGQPFEIEREPLWSNNGYASEIVLPDSPGAGAGPGRPSAFRVAAELNRLLPGGAHAAKVRRMGEAYIAEIVLQSGTEPQLLADSMPRRSSMVAQVVALPPEPPPPGRTGRVERWLVTLRR